jgi:hypothetical protein
MNGLKNLIQTEPALLVGLVQSAIGIGTAFGLGWTAEQVAIVLAFTGTLLSVIARSMVTPTVAVEQQVADEVEATLLADAPPLTDEERATLTQLRAERDGLVAAVRRRTGVR